MQNYDVVIIGAGPAGLCCASILARSDLKVLLLEQQATVGKKICAGGLTPAGLDFLQLPQDVLERTFPSAFFCTPKRRTEIVFKKPMATIDRENLGQWQFEKLKRTQIEIRTNTQVTNVSRNKIVLSSGETIEFKFLVGADGSASIVRRFLKLPNRHTFLGLQYLIPDFPAQHLETHFDSKLFRSGYAWIFPHKNYASIGCGSSSKHLSAKDLQKNFHTWLEKKRIDYARAEYQAFPINADYRGHQFGNIFLAGDAAGVASELTGEGILPALISGEAVAELILGEKKSAEFKMQKLLATHRFHRRAVVFWERMGCLRGWGFELTALLLRNSWVARKFLERVY